MLDRPSQPLRHAQRFGRWLALGVVATASGCGTEDTTQSPAPASSRDVHTSVASRFNVCPTFDSSLVVPQRLKRGDTATVITHASDADGPLASLVYDWRTSSGHFASSTSGTTTFECSEAGTVMLTVSARDLAGCTSELTLYIECLDS